MPWDSSISEEAAGGMSESIQGHEIHGAQVREEEGSEDEGIGTSIFAE